MDDDDDDDDGWWWCWCMMTMDGVWWMMMMMMMMMMEDDDDGWWWWWMMMMMMMMMMMRDDDVDGWWMVMMMMDGDDDDDGWWWWWCWCRMMDDDDDGGWWWWWCNGQILSWYRAFDDLVYVNSWWLSSAENCTAARGPSFALGMLMKACFQTATRTAFERLSTFGVRRRSATELAVQRLAILTWLSHCISTSRRSRVQLWRLVGHAICMLSYI